MKANVIEIFNTIDKVVIQLEVDLKDYRELEKKEYNVDFKIKRESKTNRQRKYIWELIGEIADKLYMTPIEVYVSVIKKAEIKTEIIACKSVAIATLYDLFRHIEMLEENEEMNVYECYYGLSKMTKEEASILIEEVINYCRMLSINYDLSLLGGK